MKSLRMLHLGDVHYPEARKETLADVGDLAFPPTFTDLMLMKPLQRVIRAAMTEHSRQPFDGLLLCGDLTTHGRVDAYAECAGYLSQAFGFDKWHPDRIHIVPGNHDLDRTLVDPAGQDVYAKFEPFRDAWRRNGKGELTVEIVRTTTFGAGRRRVLIASINSSIGCGERRHLPTAIANELTALLGDLVQRAGLDAAFSVVGETLDTPGFQQTDVDAVCERIAAADERTLPLILTHHNLLPQAILRLQMYAEVINAGHVRSRLSRLGKSVIYCHGHIHDSPVEIVTTPDNLSSRVVSISAPELRKGFNVIEVEYGVKGIPLGCRILRFQLSSRDGEMSSEAHRVPFFVSNYKHIRNIAHPKLPAVISTLPDSDMRFLDVLDWVRSSDATITRSTLIDVLQEGHWLGLLTLEDDDQLPKYWTIRKVVR